MFGVGEVAFVLFLEACAEAVRLNSVGTHPIYPHIVVLSFTLWAASFRWQDWSKRAEQKRQAVLTEFPTTSDDATPKKTIVGFFHPYCNAGGGGELVLWTAIAHIQRTEPNVICAIYSGDTDSTKEDIIQRAKGRFDVDISPNNLTFVWLQKRRLVHPTTWPRFTLVGQSAGSVLLAIEALDLLVPDIFIDSMGYGFTFPLLSVLSRVLRRIPVGAYIHYPTISTDMLERVKNRKSTYANRGDITSSWWKSYAKLMYYRVFAFFYSIALLNADEIVVNSSWTKEHVDTLVATGRKWLRRPTSGQYVKGAQIIYPPCNLEKLRELPLEHRERVIVSVAQFRPEKEHEVQIRALSGFLKQHPEYKAGAQQVRLVLIGSCRDEVDEARVEMLRGLAKELDLEKNVEFAVNAPYSVLLKWLSCGSVGISTMVQEHFGINIVEYMASGLIPLVHASGGPYNDIVRPYPLPSEASPDNEQSQPTGYHATTVEVFSDTLATIYINTSDDELLLMRERARKSVLERFGRENFEKGWEKFWNLLKDEQARADLTDRKDR